jgi:hypothetical protein
MRFLLAGALATLTAAGLATIHPAVPTDGERVAAHAIDEARIRADARFLSSELLASGTLGERVARAYLASRFEAMGLEPGCPGGASECPGAAVAVAAALRGDDPDLSGQAVLYTARLLPPGPAPDADVRAGSALGLAGLLAIAEAFAALPERPGRSVLFAAVADDGPADPSAGAPALRLAAHIDLDGARPRGRAREIRLAGLGTSSLDDWTRVVAGSRGRAVVPAARAGGEGGWVAAGEASGAAEDARLLFLLGSKVAGETAADRRDAPCPAGSGGCS